MNSSRQFSFHCIFLQFFHRDSIYWECIFVSWMCVHQNVWQYFTLFHILIILILLKAKTTTIRIH